MTYRDLLTRVQNSILVLASGTSPEADIDFDGAQTTKVRYAAKKNRDRLQDELEHYQELLKEKAEELDLEPDVLQTIAQKRLQGKLDTEEAGGEATEAVDDVLDTEPAFEPYQVTEAALMKEPGVPIPVLDLVDWMIRGE
jgi:arginine utilization protein RocB